MRRADQLSVAVLLMAGAASMGCYLWIQSRGGVIDIDRADPLEARFQVDVNQAQWPELAQLPGIGEVLARRIVDSRVEAGDFTDLDSLRRVRGIGPRTIERLRPYLLPLPDDDAVAGK